MLPAQGTVTLSNKKKGTSTIALFNQEEQAFATLDFGKGMWPYATTWNWGSFSGLDASGKNLIGLNMGGQWTDGTGMTENAVCVNGKLFKITQDIEWKYNRKNFLEPWTMRSGHLPTAEKIPVKLNLTFTPEFDCKRAVDLLVLKTSVMQMLGVFSGEIEVEGKVYRIQGRFGWAEEHKALW